jgi:hypothetical protein
MHPQTFAHLHQAERYHTHDSDSGKQPRCMLQLQPTLSRLDHRLPGREAHPEVVQGTTDFHHEITDAFFPQADAVFDDPAALDTAVDMLDPEPTLGQRLVRPLLLPRERLATGLLGRPEDRHLGQCERQEAQLLSQPAPCG